MIVIVIVMAQVGILPPIAAVVSCLNRGLKFVFCLDPLDKNSWLTPGFIVMVLKILHCDARFSLQLIMATKFGVKKYVISE